MTRGPWTPDALVAALRRGPLPHRAARRAALAGGPDGPVDARRVADEVAPRPRHLVLRDLRPRRPRAGLRAVPGPATGSSSTATTRPSVRATPVPSAASSAGPARTTSGVYRGNVDDRMRDLVDTLDEGALDKLVEHDRARLPPRAAAPGAAAHGHQARALAQPAPAGLRRRAVVRRPSPTGSAGSTSRAGSSRSGTAASRVRFDNELAAAPGLPRALPARRPARDQRRVAGVHGRRRLPARRSCGCPTAGRRVQRRGLARAASTGPRLDGVWLEHTLHGTWPVDPGAAGQPRQPLRGRRVRRLGRASGCRPRPSGSTASVAAGGDVDGQPRRPRDLPPARGRPGDRPAAPGLRRLLGVDLLGLPPLPRLPPGRRSDRRVQREVHVQPDGAARRLRAHPGRVTPAPATATSSRPASAGRCPACGSPTAEHRRRSGPMTGAREPEVAVAARPRLGRPAAWSTTCVAASARHPRTLPPKWLYDDRGSRAVRRDHPAPRVLPVRGRALDPRVDHAADIAQASGATTLVELGSGTSEKTRLLLDAFTADGQLTRFAPVDVAEQTLREAADQISAALPGPRGGRRRRRLHPAPRAPAARRAPDGRLPRRHDRQPLPRGAARLPRRPGRPARAGRLGPARHRPGQERRPAASRPTTTTQGVTAAFIGNALRVLNRELGADFDLDAFSYIPFWDRAHGADGHAAAVRDAAAGDHPRRRPGARPRRAVRRSGSRSPPSSASARSRAELEQAGLEVTRVWTDRAGDFALTLATKP